MKNKSKILVSLLTLLSSSLLIGCGPKEKEPEPPIEEDKRPTSQGNESGNTDVSQIKRESVTINYRKIYVDVNSIVDLTCVITNLKGDPTFEISDPSIATLTIDTEKKNIAHITGVKEGKVNLTATLLGKSSICEVEVLAEGTEINTQNNVWSIKDVTLNHLDNFYANDEDINFDEVTVTTTDFKGNTKELTHGEVDTEFSNLRKTTEFVLNTHNLKKQNDVYTLGNYDIDVTLVDPFDSEKALEFGTKQIVTIGEDQSKTLALSTFALPENIQKFNTINKDAEKEHDESSFKNKADEFIVGDDNPFVFKPQITVFDKKTQSPTTKAKIKLNIELSKVDGATKTLVDNTYYSYNTTSNSFTFTPLALNNTFEIKVTPKYFTELESHAPITPLVLNIKVKDGYNCYNAMDLGRINLFTGDKNAVFRYFPGGNGITDLERIVYNNGKATYNSVAQDYFFDPDSNTLRGPKNTFDIWEDFYKEKGYEESDIKEVNGLFFQNDISITKDDIPSDFFITQDEINKYGYGDYSLGTLRDRSYLYQHYLHGPSFGAKNTDGSRNDGPDFEVNGNMFNLDTSDIPLSRSNSDYAKFLFDRDTVVNTCSHARLFSFVNQYDGQSTSKAYLKNISSNGNLAKVIKDVSQSNPTEGYRIEDAAGAIKFADSDYGTLVVDNTNVKSYQVAYSIEADYGAKAMEILNSKIFDCYTSGVTIWGSNNNLMKNTEMKRFGGPCILGQSVQRNCGQEGSKIPYIGHAGITCSDDCDLESLLTGNEVWFNIFNATSYATTMKDFDKSAINQYGKTLLTYGSNDDKTQDPTRFNMLFIAVPMSFPNSTEPLRCNFKYNGYKGLDTSDGDVAKDGASVDSTSGVIGRTVGNTSPKATFRKSISERGWNEVINAKPATPMPLLQTYNLDSSLDNIGCINPGTGNNDGCIISGVNQTGPVIRQPSDKLKGDYASLFFTLNNNTSQVQEIAAFLGLYDYSK